MKSTLAREGKIDVRVDEEQNKKLQEIIKILFDAGYHRARIKGLSPFDKIVGGMTWCIELSNFDIDVDLLFHDSLTIGQKIALTERIVRVLPLMKCPHKVEPHQIQGLDTIHVYPVVKWLVGVAVSTRAEYEEQTKLIALDEFKRNHGDEVAGRQPESEVDQRVVKLIRKIRLMYTPRRRYRQPSKKTSESTSASLIYTLLEYGDQGRMTAFEEEAVDLSEEAYDKQLWSSLKGQMVSAEDDETDPKNISLQGIEHQHESLMKQVEQKREELQQLTETDKSLKASLEHWQEKLNVVQAGIEECESRHASLNASHASRISELVSLNEQAKVKLKEFKDSCRKEADVLNEKIEKIHAFLDAPEDTESIADLTSLRDSENERLKFFQKRLAKKTREIGIMRRKIDDVPGGAELAQYQRRFVELYDLVAAQQHEMQQFYSLYNTLTDEKACMEKEIGLLNSILDNMEKALETPGSLDEFLRQLELMIEGIKQNKLKSERKLAEVKAERDALKDELHRLQELHLQYVRLVHEFSREASKNEVLISVEGQQVSGG